MINRDCFIDEGISDRASNIGMGEDKVAEEAAMWQRRYFYPRFRLTEREMNVPLSGAIERMILSTNGFTIRSADDGELIENAV